MKGRGKGGGRGKEQIARQGHLLLMPSIFGHLQLVDFFFFLFFSFSFFLALARLSPWPVVGSTRRRWLPLTHSPKFLSEVQFTLRALTEKLST